MIKTAYIQLSENAYLKILLTKYYRQNWWLFAWLAVLSASSLFIHHKSVFSYLIISSPVLYATYVFLFFRHFAYKKQSRKFFLGRYYEIGDGLLTAYVEDGTQSQSGLEHIVKLYKTNNYVLLYLSPKAFLYLPKSAFAPAHEYDEAIGMIEQKMKAV